MAAATMTLTTTESKVTPKNTMVHFNVERQCPVQYVTVYNDRAEVTRLVKHNFENDGTHELIFQGFSPSVDLKSLYVSGATSKACTILEVSYQTRTEKLESTVDLTSVDQLRNDLKQAVEERNKHQRELNRLNKQRSWLDGRATKLMQQDALINPDTLDFMNQFMEFYYKSLLKIDEDSVEQENIIQNIKIREEQIQEQINKRGANGKATNGKTVREVTIVVHIGTKDIEVSLEIAYLISNCSWTASYDVRVNNSEATKPRTQLTYYGNIINQSQENWLDVQLALSTAQPSLSGVAPTLKALKVDYYQEPMYLRSFDLARMDQSIQNNCISIAQAEKKSKSFSFRGKTSLKSETLDEDDEVSNTSVNVLETKTESSLSSTSFSIPRRATIEADGKPHKVTIGVLDLASTFTYTVIPKISTHAFLRAKTVNTSDKQLLAGPAAVFIDNNFITHSALENVCVGDVFDLSLGTDSSIKVEYKTIKKLSDSSGILNKVKNETIRHETRLNNTKPFEVTVFVSEQIPSSNNEKIKVKLLQPELRQKDRKEQETVTLNDSNNLEWKCILSSRAETRLVAEYNVEWPVRRRIEYKDA